MKNVYPISYCKTQMDEDDKCPICQFTDSSLLALGCPSHLLVGTMPQDCFKCQYRDIGIGQPRTPSVSCFCRSMPRSDQLGFLSEAETVIHSGSSYEPWDRTC